MKKQNKTYLIIFLFSICFFILSQCATKKTNGISEEIFVQISDTVFKTYIGNNACQSCHADICDSYLTTAHNLTSGWIDSLGTLGSFKNGKNEYAYNANTKVQMEQKGSSYFQNAFFDNKKKHSQKMDITLGYGRNGQTFLYWLENSLYQLPISYYTAINGWGNSPGYPPNDLHFERNIIGRCLECHATNAQITSPFGFGPVKFKKESIIWGIGCERCHGPGSAHADYHNLHATDTVSRYIINAGKLSQSQQLDACALCHSGTGENIVQPFSFKVGDNLSKFLKKDYAIDTSANLDVHGNQYGLITSSECFIKSKRMTCSTCHNTHETQKGNTKMFSQKCMDCHKPDEKTFCKAKENKEILMQNCIDCHMPVYNSNSLPVNISNKTVNPIKVRTHLIKVYKKEIAAIKNLSAIL